MIDNWELKYIVEQLKEKNTEEANRMATKLENMKHNDEYVDFRYKLIIETMLDSFSKHF